LHQGRVRARRPLDLREAEEEERYLSSHEVIKINAITVPAESGDELARRFAARAGAVDGQEGFEGFELLRPTDGRNQWLVVTRWRDEDSFQAWVSSPAFAHGHAGADRPAPHGGPVSVSSELWSYEVAGGSSPPEAG
jgi:heme-degrading monooxygenase HmoA